MLSLHILWSMLTVHDNPVVSGMTHCDLPTRCLANWATFYRDSRAAALGRSSIICADCVTCMNDFKMKQM